MPNRPHVGIGVIVMRDGKVLVGKRIGTHGEGTWSFTGGHLEYGETPESCALREVREECGIHISNVRRGPYTNDIHSGEGKHGVTLFVLADWESGEPEILEPDVIHEWRWCEWSELPQPLFLPIINLQDQGFNPFEAE